VNDTVVIIDGEVQEPGESRVSVFDHGFLFGDSVYEVVRTRDGEPFMLTAHVERLRRSAAEIYMDLPYTDEDLEEEVGRAIQKVDGREAYVRIIVTRGAGELELHPVTCARPTLVLIARPLVRPSERLYREGVRLAIVPRRRTHPQSLNPAAKTGNYLNNVLAIIEARRRGADDAIMLNADGHLTEGTTANVFLVREGIVRTPSLESGILEGITRGLVIRLVEEEGLDFQETLLGAEDLRDADEAFLTSTTRDVMPVREVDGSPLRGGAPGPVTRRIAARYESI
jgi:branched-chain amino acid aminotransferase